MVVLNSSKVGFPYRRQVGVKGEWANCENADEYLYFLRNNPKAVYLWADSEELLAMANLYQIDLKIITSRGPDDANPTMNIISPAKELQEFSILPPGKVPDMTLIHTNDSHYDLLVSRSSRLAQSFFMKEEGFKLETDELTKLKEDHEKLKCSYSESLKEITTLKNEIHEMKHKNNIDNSVCVDDTEDNLSNAKVIVDGKQKGFTREGPQSKPIAKPVVQQQTCQN